MEENRESNQLTWFDRTGAACVLEQLGSDKLWLRGGRGGFAVLGREEAVELWGRLGLWLDTGSIFYQPEENLSAAQFAVGYEQMPEE